MKKLLATAAFCGLVAGVAAPAQAQESALKLNLGGHMKGYVAYVDQDEVAGADTRKVDILRDTEIHFTGETTLDNGLTVGYHAEIKAQKGEDTDTSVDESYAYFSGNWGRVNFGDEDGAAYLLQVAAPSADSNIDGVRQFVNPVNYSAMGVLPAGVENLAIDYANDFARGTDKVTYLTPVFNGFQLGASYTPDAEDTSRRLNGISNTAGSTYGDVYEVAARYEGAYRNVGFAAGAGYTQAQEEGNAAAGAFGSKDFKEWNVGLDLDIGAFGLGAVWTENNNGASGTSDNNTWVVGGDYTVGAYKLGVSYLNNNGVADTTIDDTDRYTAGVVYSYAPGLSFRGSVSYVDHDLVGGDSADATSVLVGTQINF